MEMIKSKVHLSVITINYNDAAGLEATILSVVSQTYPEIEFIIIDGYSTDESREVIRKYQSDLTYWVSEKDTGIYNAMNKGINAATGDYLLFLNSGDVFNGNTALEDFVTHPDFEGDIIYGDYKFEKGGKVYPDHLTPLFFMRTSLPHQSTLFHKNVFEKMGMYDEKYRIVSDRAFYIKCFLSNQFIFRHINYALSVFDLSGVSNTVAHKKIKITEDEMMFQEYYGVYYEDYKKMLALESELNQVKKKTLSGIGKRIVNKIKHVCRIH
ncbi:glycosyltransferase family 2 protein [Flavobacterium enshiense]|uniref:glycosyltransferase family 2 protein n=1 Tax=Flavobacterium enshiense TaxID=1341165 RepID=UPI00345DA566